MPVQVCPRCFSFFCIVGSSAHGRIRADSRREFFKHGLGFSKVLEAFRMDDRERYEQGMKTRRVVLGDAHVDATLKDKNEFTDAFQDFITRYAWGEIWSRPGLPKETRSLLTLAMMVALNRPDELRMHLRAALNIGITREQIQEVLLQTAIYCGLPAANSAFHTAMEVFSQSCELAAAPEVAKCF